MTGTSEPDADAVYPTRAARRRAEAAAAARGAASRPAGDTGAGAVGPAEDGSGAVDPEAAASGSAADAPADRSATPAEVTPHAESPASVEESPSRASVAETAAASSASTDPARARTIEDLIAEAGSDDEDEPRPERPARRTTKKPPRVTVTGVIGELLITAGVLVLLFLFWQLWLNDIIVRSAQDDEASQLAQEWADAAGDGTPEPTTDPDDPDKTAYYEPVVPEQPADTEVFGVMMVPRFGADYASKVAGGVTRPGTLDPIGIGHYLDTQLPGEAGNFAVAGHRTTYGKPLNQIASLRVGDAIVLQTKDGWYVYRFRNIEYVTPTQVDVLNPIPQSDSTDVTESYITLTACSPMYSAAERIVAYGVFESFTPTAAGEPDALTEGVEG